MVEKRAYGVTNSEVSAVFWGISVMIRMIVIVQLSGMKAQVELGNPSLAMTFSFMMSLIVVSIFFDLISMFIPNYAISKFGLNLFIDRITNPDFIGWIRFTRDRGIRFHTVKVGSHGDTKGVVNGKKADVINNGDFTINLANGNKAVCIYDFLSMNENLEENVGWNLISKHYAGVVGFKAHEKAVDTDNLMFKLDEEETEGDSVES